MTLKLGKETGSMQNYLLSGTIGAPEPKVGDGATVLAWTDRHAATIIKVTPATVTVQYDRAVRLDNNGMSECQSYRYERNPEGIVRVFRKTKRGWRETGGGSALRIGERLAYHDYSF